MEKMVRIPMLQLRCDTAQPFYFIHGFRRLVQYSTSSSSSTPPCLSNYLVDSLGFSNQQALSTSAKLTHVRQVGGAKVSDVFDFAANADSVIDFLNHNGLAQSQIRNIVSSLPRILLANVDKTLKPKFKLIQELGISRSDLAQVIVNRPLLLFQRLSPTIQAFRQVMGCDEDVVRIMKRSTYFSFSVAGKRLIHNTALLESYEIPRDKIKKSILQQPIPFVLRTELFRDIVNKVEHKWGIPRYSGTFLRGIHLVAGNTEKTIDAKCQIFKSFGWTEDDIRAIIRQNPCCLASSEASLKKKLEFLMNELGYEPAFLASCCSLFTCSLEKRLVPRHRALQVLKEKDLVSKNYSFYTIVCLSESKFLERFVEPFKDVIPDLCQDYIKSREHPQVPVVLPLPTRGRAAAASPL